MHAEADWELDTPHEGIGYLWADNGDLGVLAVGAWARDDAPWLDIEVQESTALFTAETQLDTMAGFAGGVAAQASRKSAGQNLGVTTISGLWGYDGSRPVLDGDTLFATLGDRVVALDTRGSGELLWEHTLEGDVTTTGGRLATAPVVGDGELFVVTHDGILQVLDLESGELVAEHDTAHAVRTQPAVADGKVVISTVDGWMLVVEREAI